MALSDPLSITFDGVPTPMPRIETGARKAVYGTADNLTKLTVSHSDAGGGRTRHLVRLDMKMSVEDQLNSAVHVWKNASVYVVFDVPDFGWPPDYMVDMFGQLKAICTDAIAKRICSNES